MTRMLARVGGALVLTAVLVGPSAHAHAPSVSDHHARPAFGHTTNEWLMMGRHCGASIAGT